MKRLILLAAFVFALPAHGSTEVIYLGHHPSGGCRWVFRKDAAQFIEFAERKRFSPDVVENVLLVHKKINTYSEHTAAEILDTSLGNKNLLMCKKSKAKV